MKTGALIRLFVCLLCFLSLHASAGSNESTILSKIDEANKIADNFAFSMEISALKEGDEVDRQKISGYVTVSDDETIKSLIRFDAPENVKGRKMLIEGNYIWAAFPRTRNLIRLSPLQVMLGEVAYGDVLRILYDKHYEVDAMTSVEVGDQKHLKLKLSLKPEHRGSGYGTIDLLVVADSLKLVEAKLYGSSGKHMKTARFSEPTEFLGRSIASKITIESALSEGSISILHYKKFLDKTLPGSFYNKSALNRLEVNEL